MHIADNVLRHALRDVYWVLGGACGGKTTAAARLSAKYGIPHYNADERTWPHKQIANEQEQPALCRKFDDWEQYFARPVPEYARWLHDTQREAIDMCIMELIAAAEKGPVIFEGHAPIEVARRLAPRERIVYLHADEAIVRRDYFGRADKDDMLNLIRSLSDPEAILENIYATVAFGNLAVLRQAEEAGLKIWRRETDGSAEQTIEEIERHFGWDKVRGINDAWSE
ncbi:hypothetical protein CDO73_10725 [Saccharibacillus sp. O23]|uniref:hypothetical protein n=1 Tax=Saccharibacillus sp. O23 TaxID=2009338 RepID=UPI000B4E6715|nr:hypothetical protein [Saccharibacillus sp. O23]OWR30388.1 hypothetical protein CDO73_10725 [Saccharibacillus sp. O23]